MPFNMVGTVEAVHIGCIAPLGPYATPSAFGKRAAADRVLVSKLGLAGDEQADLKVHGGPDKAVYAYPIENYPSWIAAFPANAHTLIAGGMGENLVTSGLDEHTVRIGDIHRIGSAILQVTQPRQPCFKLGLFHDAPKMVRHMTKTGLSGWYLRVLQAGEIGRGDRIELSEQAPLGWTVHRFALVTARKEIASEVLTEIAAMPGLAENWRLRAFRRLSE